jgi:flagellar hook-associated protein 2
MGQITTGIGLVSGIDFGSIVEQLVELEARPKTRIEQQNETLASQQAAFQQINANLLSMKLAADGLTTDATFTSTTSASSNEDVLTVSSGAGATPGNYSLSVQRLVGAQQTISRGYADASTSPIGPGLLTFDRVESRLDRQTRLGSLNGGDGITRGLMRLTDRSGSTAIVDLSSVVTLDDIVDTINQTTGVNVVASVSGDRLTLSDATGLTDAALSAADVGNNGVASSLGLVLDSTADGDLDDTVLTGAALNTLGRQTLLSDLNDGKGIRTTIGVPDLTLTTAGGANVSVNLDGVTTLGDLMDLVDEQSAGDLAMQVSDDGLGVVLVDNTGGGAGFTIGSAAGGFAAEDLGIAGADDDADAQLGGSRLVAALDSKLLKYLGGGLGLAAFGGSTVAPVTGDTALADLLGGAGVGGSGNPSDDITITARDGSSFSFDVDTATTVDELATLFNTGTSGKVTLALSGNRLVLSDNTEGLANLVIADKGGSSSIATDLGLVADAPTSSITSVDLDPATTLDTGAVISVTNSAGVVGTVDLNTAVSVSDVIDQINAASLGITASLNDAGNGLRLVDTADGNQPLIIADAAGSSLATQLGLVGTHSDGAADGGDLQYQYVHEGTLIDSLGIARGRFELRDSGGSTATVDISQGNEQTIGDVLSEINSRGLLITARVNDTGDGIVLEDIGPGVVNMSVEEVGSTTARDLGILGVAPSPGADLNGSFQQTVNLAAGDTLDAAVQKINDAGLGINASIINDGTAGAPFRLSLASDQGGRRHGFVFDDGGLGMGARQLAEAQDAVVFFGADDPASALLLTSQTNTLDTVIPGAQIDLLSTSDKPVQVTISEDREAVVESVQELVSAFNEVTGTLNEYDSYDAENEVRGLLLGDPTVSRVRQSIYNAVINPNNELGGQYKSLAQVGVTVGPGARLQLDGDKLAEALETDPQGVRDLFTFEQFAIDPETGEQDRDQVLARGIGVEISQLLDRLTRTGDGVVTEAVDVIDEKIEANRQRIEDIDESLEEKRARYEEQFIAMERALSQMQGQSNALNQLGAAAAQSQAALAQ